MAKMYFRYGIGKSANLCQTAYNYREKGMDVIVMNPLNENVKAKIVKDGKTLLVTPINYEIGINSIYTDISKMNHIKCILVDNAHLLKKEQVEDLFYLANINDITIITYGDRTIDDMSTEGSMRLMELSNVIEPVEIEYKETPNLEFFYGAMNASKTANLLTKHYSLVKNNVKTLLIKPKLDRDEKSVGSRIGLTAEADIVLDSDNGLDEIPYDTKYILVDEAQFLTREQIDALRAYNDLYKIPVRCYGLKTDFRSFHFEGSGRLLEIADSLIKLKTICSCGEGAEMNARIDSNGNYINKGDAIAIDNGTTSYDSLCPKCYVKRVLGINR